MKIIVIIQARLGSSRLPGKAALDMHGMPILARVIERCRLTRMVSEICVATSQEPSDDILCWIAQNCGASVHRGSLEDVRRRMLGAAQQQAANAFLRVTGDNPFTDPALLDDLIEHKLSHPACPYLVHDLANTVYGTAAEMVDVNALSMRLADLPHAGREHVTTGLSDLSSARILQPPAAVTDTKLSLTVDTFEQYLSVWTLMHRYGGDRNAVPKIVKAWQEKGHSDSVFQTRAAKT